MASFGQPNPAKLEVVRLSFDSQGNASVAGTLSGLAQNAGIVWDPIGRIAYISLSFEGGDTIQPYRVASNHSTTQLATIKGNGLNGPDGMVITCGVSFWSQTTTPTRFLASRSTPRATRRSNGIISGNGLSNPAGLAIAPWGELFAANQGHRDTLAIHLRRTACGRSKWHLPDHVPVKSGWLWKRFTDGVGSPLFPPHAPSSGCPKTARRGASVVPSETALTEAVHGETSSLPGFKLRRVTDLDGGAPGEDFSLARLAEQAGNERVPLHLRRSEWGLLSSSGCSGSPRPRRRRLGDQRDSGSGSNRNCHRRRCCGCRRRAPG